MSQSADIPTSHSRAAEIATPSPAEVRTSEQRAEEIKQYILGLLPAHISKSVDVVITRQVPTAAVLPATEDALLTDEQAEFDRQQARRLIESVDGDYLVLITARETPDAAPLNDELSADRAHQFGLAFHETLHILKTAFKGIQTLLNNEVEERHQDFVHDLINATEDGAIEHEVYVGEDFSTRAGNRLRLVREIHKRKPEDYEALPDHLSEFTFRDALQKALHDNVILPPSGTTSALLDEDDDRVTFASDEERAVFLQIYPEIEQLADDIHSIRGDVGTELHRNDAEASIRRAKRTIKFWHEVVKPLVAPGASEQEQEQDQQQQQSGSDGEPGQSGEQEQAGESASSDQSSSAGRDGEPQQDATQSGSQDTSSALDSGGEGAPSDDIDPEDLSLERNAVSDSLQGVADHPSIIDEPDPGDVDLDPDDADGGDDSASNADSSSARENEVDSPRQESGSESSTDVGSDSTSGDMPDTPSQMGSGEESESGEGESSTGGQGSTTDAPTGDDAGESDSGSGGKVEVESTSDSSDLASSTQSSSGASTQSTFGDFAQDGSESESGVESEDEGEQEAETGQEPGVGKDGDTPAEQEPESSQNDNADGEQTSSEDAMSAEQGDTSPGEGSSPSHSEEGEQPGQSAGESTPTVSGGGQSESSRSDHSDSGQQSESEASTQDSPDASSTSGVSGPEQSGEELSPEDFESDRKRAQQTADEISSDGDALERELEALDQMLRENAEAGPDEESGGSGAGAGSIDELSVLPDPKDGAVSETDWGAVEKAAGTVADTLAKQLRLDQQTGVRSGLTSGTTVNRKTAHRLGYGDPRVFETEIPGDEKEYFVVIVLDRSGSMDPTRYNNRNSDGPTKIQVATSAVARFAVACEDLGIDVAVVDFYDDTARLAKPASVDAEFAQEALLNTDSAGGTPLSDALTLASSLAEMDSKESIIITMTDGKPGDVDATREVIKQSFAPVCSLTVATDCEPGNPPEKAEKLESYYDQSTTVFDSEKLDDRLDEFASLLGAY